MTRIDTDVAAEQLAAEAAEAFPGLVWFPATAHGSIPCALTKVAGVLCSYGTSGVSGSKVISEVPSDLKEHLTCL
jgi:hypothetical protein